VEISADVWLTQYYFSSLSQGPLLVSGQSDVISSVANFVPSLYICWQEGQICFKWVEEYLLDCNVGVTVCLSFDGNGSERE
jgi:hypothetical protein